MVEPTLTGPGVVDPPLPSSLLLLLSLPPNDGSGVAIGLPSGVGTVGGSPLLPPSPLLLLIVGMRTGGIRKVVGATVGSLLLLLSRVERDDKEASSS